MSEDEMVCQSCGKDFDILMTTNKRKNMDGSSFWVCQDCFKEIEGVGYEDFRLSKTQE
jgi:ribosomal protein L37AE/L43A